MKKKLMLLITLTALCAVGCVQNPTPTPTVTSNIGPINGLTNVNPKEIEYIDISFPESMDMNYYNWIHYDTTYDSVIGYKWFNDTTYRIYVSLEYDILFKIVINDSTYTDPKWDPKKEFFRNRKGEYAEEIVISFNTIPYPERESMTHTIDLTDKDINFREFKTIKLQPNQYDENGNQTDTPVSQQFDLSLKNLLNKELVLEGDILKLKYKISSTYDISNVKVNLFDSSEDANYWLLLSSDKDLQLAPDYTINTEYEGELVFNISESMIKDVSIQFYAFYRDTPENVSFTFIQENE